MTLVFRYLKSKMKWQGGKKKTLVPYLINKAGTNNKNSDLRQNLLRCDPIYSCIVPDSMFGFHVYSHQSLIWKMSRWNHNKRQGTLEKDLLHVQSCHVHNYDPRELRHKCRPVWSHMTKFFIIITATSTAGHVNQITRSIPVVLYSFWQYI